MNHNSNFKVYNASAGSGKTFTLVKEYLKVLLTNEDIFTFQKILAITFTNKAAGEMKERVLLNLEEFSEGKENDLLQIILDEIPIDKTVIQERSKKILEAILQNYSAFSITTIDSFTHKLIKNFAFDLGLSLNFEVEMDAISLLNEAVDVLISKIGVDQKLTDVLVQYSLDKTDDDKSWDISRDLSEFAKILLNEDDVQHFRKLAAKSLDDFTNLKSKLYQHQKQLKLELIKIGEDCLKLISNVGLSQKDFMRGTIPKFFLDLSLKSVNFDVLTRSITIEKAIEKKEYYKKNTHRATAEAIEGIIPEIILFFHQAKKVYSQFMMNKLALKSIIPLAVLNNINSALEEIKEDSNIRLNAEFNQLISDNIKDQPAPFIYERIGQRFQHYFIDEMQDTSVLQWQNLIPLVDNALAQENSGLMIVGDGKQAIYRWRGGKAEQFINLASSEEQTTLIQKEIRNLETNYRSYSEIIRFNNSFFQHSANFLQNETYKKLFLEGNQQKENSKKGGFVSLTFLDKENDKEDEGLKYPKKVLERILELKSDFSLSEMCVLTRKRKDGVEIANYLTENGIPIISSETLLLQNNEKVIFIVNVLKMLKDKTDEETRFEFLYFLYNHLQIITNKHTFFKEFAKQPLDFILNGLSFYGIHFEVSKFFQMPFYEKIEEIIRVFKLTNSSDAYVQYFLDVVLDQQRKGVDIAAFLDFWELKKDKLSIVAPEGADAVQIMTIHKSKGLEFPVVIFPYDLNIYRQMNPKTWLDQLPETYQGFEELLVDYSKSLEIVSERGLALYNQQREELELDNFNLLYVVLTRAVEQLHVVTALNVNAKGEVNTQFYSGVFISYLQQQNIWQEDKLNYTFGDSKRVSVSMKEVALAETHQDFISSHWQEHQIVLLASSSKLWNTEQGKAIDYGNLLHEIFAKIKTSDDVQKIISAYIQQGILNKAQATFLAAKIHEVVNHKDLKNYFSDSVTIFNEREIVDEDNQVIIPDRLVFNANNEVVIIDYKTGKLSPEHPQQLKRYEAVLQKMDIMVLQKILIYINEEISLVIV